MPGIYIDLCSNLKCILMALPPLPEHNWYITDLDCLDHCGWPGCEKWASYDLFLSDEALKKDIYFRDPQIIFGVFSAVPEDIPERVIREKAEPYADGNSGYMRSRLTPQHPDAFLEITPFDAGGVFVISHDPKLLEPLYDLPFKVWDEEESNTKMNAELRRIRTIIAKDYPEITLGDADEIQWQCWHSIFKNANTAISNDDVKRSIESAREYISKHPPKYRRTVWDPFTETDFTLEI